jgi:dUTPase
MTTLAATGRENLPSSSEPAAKMQRTEVTEELRVRRLNEHAQLPKRGSAGAAGYDLARCGAGVTGGDAGPQCDFGEPLISCWSAWCLQPVPPLPSRRRCPLANKILALAWPPLSCPTCSCEDTEIPAHGRAVVKTGLQIAIPPGTYARVAPRSGLAVKHFIDTGAGVVDEDYRGEVGVVLFNHADTPFPGA